MPAAAFSFLREIETKEASSPSILVVKPHLLTKFLLNATIGLRVEGELIASSLDIIEPPNLK